MQASPGPGGSVSNRRKEVNRVALSDELKCIEIRDDEYRLQKVPDAVDKDAFDARQMRRNEILALLATDTPLCPKHSARMICPKCIASVGGRTTTTKYKHRLSRWGKTGGRGKKDGRSLSQRDGFVAALGHTANSRKSATDSESGRKKKYKAPRFTKLTQQEAKDMLAERGLPDGPVMRQLLEWIAELENRQSRKK